MTFTGGIMQGSKLKRFAVGAIIGVIGISGALGAQVRQGTAASSEFLIRNARVFDGQKTEAAEVWVRDGKIYGVGKNLKEFMENCITGTPAVGIRDQFIKHL